MKSTLAAVKRQRFPARASLWVLGLFILGLGSVPNITKITRLAIPVFWSNVHAAYSMENRFFPSRDIMRALKNGALLLKNFECTHDVTWWEKLFQGAHAWDQNPGIANLVILVMLSVPTKSMKKCFALGAEKMEGQCGHFPLSTYLWAVRHWFGEISPLWQYFKSHGQFLRFYLMFGKFLNLIWQFVYAIVHNLNKGWKRTNCFDWRNLFNMRGGWWQFDQNGRFIAFWATF